MLDGVLCGFLLLELVLFSPQWRKIALDIGVRSGIALFFGQFAVQLARIATALIPPFEQILLIWHHLLWPPFSLHDAHPLRGLFHLQIVIDCAASHIEFSGNISHIGLFAVKVVDLVIALYPFLVKLETLFFLLFGDSLMPEASGALLFERRREAFRIMNSIFESRSFVQEEALQRFRKVD